MKYVSVFDEMESLILVKRASNNRNRGGCTGAKEFVFWAHGYGSQIKGRLGS